MRDGLGCTAVCNAPIMSQAAAAAGAVTAHLDQWVGVEHVHQHRVPVVVNGLHHPVMSCTAVCITSMAPAVTSSPPAVTN